MKMRVRNVKLLDFAETYSCALPNEWHSNANFNNSNKKNRAELNF